MTELEGRKEGGEEGLLHSDSWDAMTTWSLIIYMYLFSNTYLLPDNMLNGN